MPGHQSILTAKAFVGKGLTMGNDPSILRRLMSVIEDRKAAGPPQSYTTELLDGGVDRIGAKILEEAAELARRFGTSGLDEKASRADRM